MRGDLCRKISAPPSNTVDVLATAETALACCHIELIVVPSALPPACMISGQRHCLATSWTFHAWLSYLLPCHLLQSSIFEQSDGFGDHEVVIPCWSIEEYYGQCIEHCGSSEANAYQCNQRMRAVQACLLQRTPYACAGERSGNWIEPVGGLCWPRFPVHYVVSAR